MGLGQEKVSPNIDDTTEKKRPAFVEFFARMFKEKPLGTVGAVIVILFIMVAIFADLLAPYGVNEIHSEVRLQAPSAQYVMGTDQLGRDQLSRIIFGTRISIYVGLAGSFVSTLFAVVIGVFSGYFGGKTDMILQRFVDGWMCFPPLFIYLTAMAMAGSGLLQVIIVLGTVNGIRRSRIIRAAVIGIKQNAYIDAATAIGGSNMHILRHHILPNVMSPIIVIFAVSFGYMIIGEATLSFLGFGVPPPTPSWGLMLSGTGRQFMLQAPWLAIYPGIVLAIVIFGLNMLGDAVRDLLDPRLRGGLGRYGGRKIKDIRRISLKKSTS